MAESGPVRYATRLQMLRKEQRRTGSLLAQQPYYLSYGRNCSRESRVQDRGLRLLHSPWQVCLAERAQYGEFANLTPFRALGKLFLQGLKSGPCLIHGRVAVLELLFCPIQLDKQVRGRLQIVDFVAQLAYLCINGSYLRSPAPVTALTLGSPGKL
jgi:hypothetical protein